MPLVIIDPLQAVHGGALGLLAAGSTQDLAEALAKTLVGRGAARWVTPPTPSISILDVPGAPVQALVLGAGNSIGVRTVLYGDSETDLYERSSGPSAISYSRATGVLTFTSTGHKLWTGLLHRFWNSNYPSTVAQVFLPITVVDANTYSMQIAAGLLDVPNGALVGTFFGSSAIGISYTHWLGQYMQRNGHPLDVVRNSAQSGDTTAGCLERFDRDVAAWNPQLVIMQLPGLNDQSYSTTLATSIANNRQLIDRIGALGANLLLLTTNPVAVGEPRGNVQTMLRIRAMNRDAKAYVRGKRFARVVDAYAKVVDPADATGYALASYLKAPPDRIHWNYKGSASISPLVESVLNQWIQQYAQTDTTLVRTVADCHLSSQVTLTTISRVLPDLVTVAATGHKLLAGEFLRVTGSSTAAENGVFQLTASTANSFSYTNAGGSATNVAITNVTMTLSDQAFNNPLLLTTTGGTVGDGVVNTAVAARLTCTNGGIRALITATATVAPATASGNISFVGNEQVMTITSAAAGDQPRIGTAGTTSLLSPSQILLNRFYQLEFRWRMSSSNWAITPVSQLFGIFIVTWSTGETYQVNLGTGWDAVEDPTFSADQTLHIKSAPLSTAPPSAGATLTNVQFYMVAQIGAAGSTGTLTLGMSQISVRDVT